MIMKTIFEEAREQVQEIRKALGEKRTDSYLVFAKGDSGYYRPIWVQRGHSIRGYEIAFGSRLLTRDQILDIIAESENERGKSDVLNSPVR